MKSKLFKNERVTIGLLLENLRGGFTELFWDLFTSIAEQYDLNVMIFPGESINSSKEFAYQHNIVYHFINDYNIDGLVMLSNTLSNLVDSTKLKDIYQDLFYIPTISVGIEIEGIPSIVADNEIGMREAIEHLIKVHGFRKIAFIKGQSMHYEAIIRFDTYKKVLTENGIPYDENLVYQGDFFIESGRAAVRTFLDERKVDFDVIVASNDYMAIGCLIELKDRGIHVPKDAKVIGFDNIRELRTHMSPLTTVKQPIYEMALNSVKEILKLIEGESVTKLIELPTSLVARSSCGCHHMYTSLYNIEYGESFLKDSIKDITDIKKRIHILTRENIFYSSDIEADFDWILEGLYKGNATKQIISDYKVMIFKIFETSILTEEEVDAWILLIEQIYIFFKTQEKYNQQKDLYTDFFDYARSLVVQVNMTEQGLVKIQDERIIEQLMIGSLHKLIAIEDIDELMINVEKELKAVNIKSAYISLYEFDKRREQAHSEDRFWPIPKYSKLVMGFDGQYSYKRTNKDQAHISEHLLPGHIGLRNRRYNMVIEPLFYGDEQFGYIMYELSLKMGSVYETYKRQICSALKFIFLLEDKTVVNQKLDEYAQKQKNMNSELQEALNDLKQTQSQLIQSEKMAALSTIVAGIAKEIGKPLGKGIVIASELEEDSSDMLDLIANEGVDGNKYERYLLDTIEESKKIMENLIKASELLKSFQCLVVGNIHEDVKSINLREFVEQIIISLRSNLKRKLLTVDINIPHDIIMKSNQISLSHIFVNIIENAINHGYDTNDRGTITISASAQDGWVKINISDDGMGIDPDLVNRVFDPFFKTSESKGGSGLGLNIVYNIITQSYGGKIVCESGFREGTDFKILLPLNI